MENNLLKNFANSLNCRTFAADFLKTIDEERQKTATIPRKRADSGA
jgi:hypothetical protein